MILDIRRDQPGAFEVFSLLDIPSPNIKLRFFSTIVPYRATVPGSTKNHEPVSLWVPGAGRLPSNASYIMRYTLPVLLMWNLSLAVLERRIVASWLR